jgi:anti-anti-sigma factor
MNAPEPNDTTPTVELEVAPQVRTAIVTLRGEHDLGTRPRISEALADASKQATVLVDLSECTFAESSVVAALVVARDDLRERGGRLEVVIPPDARALRRLTELARLADILPIHETRSTAATRLT